jgi:hypothetical protein
LVSIARVRQRRKMQQDASKLQHAA